MNNWAIVIGVDSYTAPHLNLKGAVRDALSMLQFLTEGDAPLVAPARAKLLLSRTEASPQAPAGFTAAEATRKNIVEAFRDVAHKPPGRLFVHFSGHGLHAPGITGGEAILPANYEPADTGQSIRVDGIRDFLRTSKFDEQFFFIDACRNTPLEGNFNIGQFPETPDPEQMRPQVQQFVFCGTLRGVKASEDRTRPNDERGVFTTPLLRGLTGGGSAKIFNEDAGRYDVTVGRLLRYVRDEVRREVLALELSAEGEVPQEPRLLGEIGDTELTIVSIAPQSVAGVELSFAVTPAEAAGNARVSVGADVDREAGPPVTEETSLSLPPRDYRVRVASPGFIPERPSWRADVYESRRIALPMRPEGEEGLETLLGTGGGPGPAWLRYRASEPLSFVRLLDARGRVLAVSGHGELNLRDLDPGVYRAQWIGAGGQSMEHSIELDEGGHEERVFEVPAQAPPAIRRVRVGTTAEAGLRIAPGGRTKRLEPGVHSIPLRSSPGVWLAVPVLWKRVTLLLDAEPAPAILFPWLDGQAEVSRLEPIEIAERYYRSGMHEAVLAMIGEDDQDPMAAMLESYSRLQLAHRDGTRNSLDRVRMRAAMLIDRFPELPDGHLLTAEVAGQQRFHCQQALDCGLPLFDFGSRRLLTHVRKFGIEHERRASLEHAMAARVGGLPWTAWLGSAPHAI